MRSIATWRFVTLLAIAMVCNCATPSKTMHTPMASEQESGGTLVRGEHLTVSEYVLGFGDVIEVKFFDNARFNETVAVRPDGRITMEKMGDIFVAGMAPSKLDSLITATYAQFVRNPEVTVFVRQFGGHQVYVLGEVNTPGAYPLQRNMTLVQAMATAGGPKHTANLRSVMVLRREQSGEINAHRLDLTIAANRSRASNIESAHYVQPQDVIYVPQTFIADIGQFTKQIYDIVLPPVDIYLRTLWWRVP